MGTYLERFSLAGKVAVVTGASEGIGRDLALGLTSAGADVVVCSRREKELLKVKTKIEKLGCKSEIFVLDIRKPGEIEKLRDFVKDQFGKIDILIANAGYSVTQPAWDITDKDWDLMVDTGFKGLFFSCQIIGSLMKEQGYGKIINLSSTFSRSLVPGKSVYAAIKAGVSHLTEALASEWASQGIRVNALAPTAVLTPSRKNLLREDVLKKILSRIPLGRLAATDDLVTAAIYLASPASDFVTGHTLFVDGGWVAAS